MAKKTLNHLTAEERALLKGQFLAAPMDDLFEQEAVALYLGCSTSLLQHWRSHGGGPAFSKIGRTVNYCKRDVVEYRQSRIVHHTAAYARAS